MSHNVPYHPTSPITVCIAARNEECTIRHAIQSVISQNYQGPLEIVVGVSASTDSTEQIVRDLSRSDSRIRLILPAPGKAAAWNLLVKEATYDTLVFMDADVLCGKDCLNNLVRYLTSTGKIAAAGNNIKKPEQSSFNSFRRAFHYPFEDRTNIGISGRLYAVKRQRLLGTMQSRGFSAMPEDLIGDDMWLMLILERREQGKVIDMQWGFCREAVAYYQPATLRDEYKRAVRVFQSYLQIEREYPQLGFTLSAKEQTVHSAEKEPSGIRGLIKSKLDMIKGLEPVHERILLAMMIVPRKVVLSTLYKRAHKEAIRAYAEKNHVWEVPQSSKKDWHIETSVTPPRRNVADDTKR